MVDKSKEKGRTHIRVTQEIKAVLAHELGHFHHNHVKKRIILMFVMSFIGLYILGIFIKL